MDDETADSVVAASEIENEEQFWAELERLVSQPGESSEDIDDALRSYLAVTGHFKGEYLRSEYHHARCCYNLLGSPLFQANKTYVRRQMLYCLLQEDDADVLHLAATVLLFDGRANETVFQMMQVESAFSRLVEMVRDGIDDQAGLHRLLIELLYEMSRMQKLSRNDLTIVDDAFILYLLQLIEELSDDANDPYHYPVIRVLLVLNEQYMCFANGPSPTTEGAAITNRILKILSAHGPSYRTFGENLILLLNRESALSAQLLILKLLYLLFTTPPTYEYFYTNDLHVLVDVIIRNLLNLDPSSLEGAMADDSGELDGQRALTHTYLRVLCPLLQNTQLSREDNNYKREEIRRMFHLLVNRSSEHFAPVDQTVIRLVVRCKQISWIHDEADDSEDSIMIEQHLADSTAAPQQQPQDNAVSEVEAVANSVLGMSLDVAGVSGLSVVDVSSAQVIATRERPSVPAPRRNRRRTQPANGAAGSSRADGEPSLLQVPAENTKTASSSSADSRVERERSPFSDDNEEV